MKKSLILSLFLLIQNFAFAQIDSLKITTDSLRVDTSTVTKTPISKVADIIKAKKGVFRQALYLDPLTPENTPGAAFIRAAVPGLGQITNKQMWKAPFVWVAAVGGIGTMNYWSSRFWYYRKELLLANDAGLVSTTFYPAKSFLQSGLNIKANPDFSVEQLTLSNERLKTIIERYRRYRDLTFIGFSVGYLITGIEAYVTAHLKNFDATDDITLRFEPMVQPNMAFGRATFGARIQINFK